MDGLRPVLVDQTEVKLQWTDINSRFKHKRPRPTRSNGIHVSGIIKYAMVEAGKLKTEDITDEFPLRMAIGMAWEDWAVGLWPKMKWQPGEKCLNDIYGSPDGITLDVKPHLSQLEEFKATWKSSRKREDITEEKLWMWQLAAYCKMLKLTRARLHVLWINGDYNPPCPSYRVYELKFKQSELDEFWVNTMLNNKSKATAEKNR